MSWPKNLRRSALVLILAMVSGLLAGTPSFASGELTVSAPTSIEYDPALSGFAVTGISITNAPSYVQVGLTLVDSSGTQVIASDEYRISTGDQCTFNPSWTNPNTGGSVTISGDDSSNVLISGSSSDVPDILDNIWIYRTNSSFCSRGSGGTFGQSLLLRGLKVSAIETQPGLMWSPSTQHYYQLVTQTTDDGMGQPTNDSGQVTDSSRYFVRWSTARAEAKSSTITIGGQTHRGYLAAITTRDEFSFLNDNVTAGSGTLYPAWVGGSDAGTEGLWKWVDGPEAAVFGGDTLTHYVQRTTAPDGSLLEQDSEGTYYINYPTDGYNYFSWESDILMMRDSSGNFIEDPDTGYWVAVYEGNYCTDYFNDPFAALGNMGTDGPQNATTQYGSYVICNVYWDGYYPRLNAQIRDGSNNVYDKTPHAIYKFGDWGYNAEDADHNNLAVVVDTSIFTTQSGIEDNYDGATFWGSDWGYGPGNGLPEYCNNRGVRGVCSQTQNDTNGTAQTNNYFVYWSNGNSWYTENWDGTGVKPGDGVYNPQPDNYTGNNSNGEDALIINWCERNAGDYSNSSAAIQSLYGNSGYHCTPGWNDLSAGNWAFSSAVYSGTAVDTPNQIGTTDYVVEYCGYSDEAACITSPGAVATATFTTATSGCPETGTPQLTVTYSEAGVDATSLTSPTMATETFDNIPTGWMTGQMTNVGYLTGSIAVGSASPYGGAGGSGNYPTMVNANLTLPKTECYIGFWWSAGNSNNHVELLDSQDNILASFDATDLVTALGPCPNSYCGNPNLNYAVNNELFAYVHMRLPTGFQKVHFYGTGFELDNISISVDVPDRVNTETNLSGPIVMSLIAPEIIPADPQALSVGFPELRVSGDAHAALCIAQASDASGALESSPWMVFGVSNNGSVTVQSVGNFYVISGAVADVITASGYLLVTRNNTNAVIPNQSAYVKIFAVASQTPDSAACEAGTSKIVELRPIDKEVTNILDLTLVDHQN